MKEYIKATDAAQILKCTPEHIYQLTAQRKIPFYKVYGKVLFDPEELEKWIESKHIEPVE